MAEFTAENLLSLLEKKPGLTTAEIAGITGLNECEVMSSLSNLCGVGSLKCIPRSHAPEGLRAEYWPTHVNEEAQTSKA